MFEPKKAFLDNRAEFERNFNVLSELVKEGRMKFSIQSKSSIDSLLKIRNLPNGRIDLNTIDEVARVTANSTSNFEHMMEPNKNVKDEKK